MSEAPRSKLEIAHVLFIDIVGYSRLLIDEQAEAVEELNQLVRRTEAAREAEAAGQLIILPTGDGMALVFTGSVEDPVECALQISQALRAQPSLQLRMGIHSGPVHHVADVNQRQNIAGAGINIAQRVMDCGDAGHILVSKRVADDLAQYRRWQPYLHDLGDMEVKHGVVVSVVNLYADVVGNPEPPQRFAAAPRASASAPAVEKKRAHFSLGLLLLLGSVLALAIAAIIFTPAITRSLERGKQTAAPPAPSVTPPPVAVSDKSIAVLPFENLSDDKANAFFADGVQDQILTDLARVADLKVISRTSVMQYRDQAKRNLRDVAQQLGVAHVVEGTVQRAANRVRINAQLIDARNDTHLWAQSYDRELADVFAIQSEIAETIATQLQAHLTSAEKAAIAKPPTNDIAAFDLFLHAVELDSHANDPGAKKYLLDALALLDQAVKRDPKFLVAYCVMCGVNLDLYWGGFDHSDARRELARVALEHAERIDPDSGDVHLAKANYAYHGFRDYDRGRAEAELARRSLPNNSGVYSLLAAIGRRQGRWEECLRDFDRAVELDPRGVSTIEEPAFTRQGLRRYAEATTGLERALALDPKEPYVRSILAIIPFDQNGDVKEWRKRMDTIARDDAELASHVAIFFLQCALAERDRAQAERALAMIPPEGSVDPSYNFLMPRAWFVGLTQKCFGEDAKATFEAALPATRQLVQEQPDYAPAWSLLGLIEAGAGHKKEAIEAGKKGADLLPLSKDAWDGPSIVVNLATIYLWTGENKLALDLLESLAKTPVGLITYGDLKYNPLWEPLRADPRFAQITALLAPQK